MWGATSDAAVGEISADVWGRVAAALVVPQRTQWETREDVRRRWAALQCVYFSWLRVIYMAGPSVGCSPRVFRGAVCTVKLYEHYIACISYYSDSTWVGVSLRTIHGATRQRQQGQRFVLVKGEEVTSSCSCYSCEADNAAERWPAVAGGAYNYEEVTSHAAYFLTWVVATSMNGLV